MGYKCISYKKKYTIVFLETTEELVIYEFIPSKAFIGNDSFSPPLFALFLRSKFLVRKSGTFVTGYDGIGVRCQPEFIASFKGSD